MKIVYRNKWCRILSKGTLYILQGKKYNDQYFPTLQKALTAIGLTHLPDNYTTKK